MQRVHRLLVIVSLSVLLGSAGALAVPAHAAPADVGGGVGQAASGVASGLSQTVSGVASGVGQAASGVGQGLVRAVS
ncbi:hypothetical protein AB8O64_30275 [Streptomyces sp. QH1-20]|uniref:hypothetical protein n=1 Tax=Streptomyces sp. QH1-20 TaxID=3240934 RepID=UPI003511AA70